MAILPIVQYPDPRLRTKCTPITEMSDEIRKKFDDMAETMYAAPGIGLAASQVGYPERILVIDIGHREEGAEVPSRLYKLANPEIVDREGSIEWEEGCLSIPTIYETVKRSESVTVRGIDEQGDELIVEAEGLLAVCFQHEIDHLDGVLFIDRLSRVRREMMKRKLAKLQEESKRR